MNWTYNNKDIKSHLDLHEDCTDIVYMLTFVSGNKYIGKKTVRSIRRLKPTKKQLAIRKNYVRKELVNLPFMDYEGSSSENEGETLLYKEILFQCSDKRTATYLEAKMLFTSNALESDEYNNANILGKFYRSGISGIIQPNTKELDEETD